MRNPMRDRRQNDGFVRPRAKGIMFWILAFLAAGSSYLLVSRLAPVVALALVGGPVLLGVLWINDHTGVSAMLVGSWQFLSGVDTPGDIVASCPSGASASDSLGVWALPLILVGLGLALLNLMLGLAVMFMLPFGVLKGIGAGARSLWTSNVDGLESGLRTLAIGLGLVIASGLIMRLMHFTSLIGC